MNERQQRLIKMLLFYAQAHIEDIYGLFAIFDDRSAQFTGYVADCDGNAMTFPTKNEISNIMELF